MNAKLLAALILGILAVLLIWGSIQVFLQPSTTIYVLFIPVGTIGPSFVAYLAGLVMLAVGGVFGYLAFKAAV